MPLLNGTIQYLVQNSYYKSTVDSFRQITDFKVSDIVLTPSTKCIKWIKWRFKFQTNICSKHVNIVLKIFEGIEQRSLFNILNVIVRLEGHLQEQKDYHHSDASLKVQCRQLFFFHYYSTQLCYMTKQSISLAYVYTIC